MMVKSLQDITIQRVNLASSITKEFVVNTKLDDRLFDTSVEFWRKEVNLVPVSLDRSSDKKGADDSVKTARFVMEGGTVWSLAFKKYRKIVSVNLCGLRNYTYANVRIDLPGAYRLSPEDIKQAIETIDSFRTCLTHSARDDGEEEVVEKRVVSR
ncbi:MAG: hypothetical protein ACE5KU_04640 [Nitrososphaerales archaeon]